MISTPSRMPYDEAEMVALRALGFIASEANLLTQFIDETGITLDDLHANADRPDTLAAVLETLLRREPDLLVFTANAGYSADSVARALAAIDHARTTGGQR